MDPCEEYSFKAIQFLEDRLEKQELDDFLAHLEVCLNCRKSVEAERALSQFLHQSRPLYSAPPALRARLAAAIEQRTTSIEARESFYTRLSRIVGSGFAEPVRRVASLRLLVATLAVTALVLAFLPNAVRQVRAANYVEMAVATHRSYLDGNVAFGIRSNSPDQVTSWFAGKVPFQFRLSQPTRGDGTLIYQLAGASLVSYRGSPAALVIYEKQNERISLLVASSQSAVVAGGEEIRFGALLFHYRTDQGFKVVTWTNHGLAYALVSSVSGSARESCMVCHQSMSDRDNFRSAR